MSEIQTIDAKQPGEIKPITVDFSDAVDIAGGDSIASAAVAVYEWDDRDQVSETLDLDTDHPTATLAEVALYDVDGELLERVQLSLNSALTTLLLQADNESAWVVSSGLTASSIGYDPDEIFFKVSGGITGMTYKLTVSATTANGLTFEQDVLLPVEEF